MKKVSEQWARIKEHLQEEYQISPVSYKTWIEPLQVFHEEENQVFILWPDETNNIMTKNLIKKKFALPLKASIGEITGIDYDVTIINSTEIEDFKLASGFEFFDEKVSEKNNNPSLISKFTFENFIVGGCNKMAQNAALAVAEMPGEAYNPLFIYSKPGLGKTHLMNAIGNHVAAENPQMKVSYITASDYTNKVIENMRCSTNASAMQNLREQYRNVDVLLIDDIQFLAGKRATQEEFFNTFNALQEAGKQIVIASDRPPRELETFDDRFVSRFLMGLVVDLGQPDYETRRAILEEKMSEKKGFILEPAIANYIAENVTGNIREIEGAISRLYAFSKITNQSITLETAINELSIYVSPENASVITPELILNVVAEHFGIDVEKLKSKSKTSNIVYARHIAMYLCKEMTTNTYQEIGDVIGGRDHSTVITSVKKITENIETDMTLQNQIETIKKKINPK